MVKFSFKPLLFMLSLIYIIQLIFGVFILFYFGKAMLQKNLEQKTSRVLSDITYKNGVWDMNKYNKDPYLIGTEPLYVFTTDGFILDRRATIQGFLDSSDFKRLLEYQNLQTISSLTGYTRRIYSKVIKNKNQDIGVVAVSYFDPKKEILDSIDTSLLKNAELLLSKIRVNNGVIDTSRIDERYISYNVSFIVVDKFNTILTKTTNVNSIGRIPNIIDPSYIKAQILSSPVGFKQDRVTKENFLTSTKLIKSNNTVIGVVVAGQSLKFISQIIKTYLIAFGIINILIVLIEYLFIYYYFKTRFLSLLEIKKPSRIYFDEKKCLLFIDKNSIEIPYATNQFYLLRTLFSNPSKRWETDELLDQFGELNLKLGVRKVYDTMININKKLASYLNEKLIINQNKTYHLNQNLPVIKSSK